MADQSRKRAYRQRVKCSACSKEMDSDYAESHSSKQHQGIKVKFVVIVEKSQKQLSFFTHVKPLTISSDSVANNDQSQTDTEKSLSESLSVCQTQSPSQCVTPAAQETPPVSAVATLLPVPDTAAETSSSPHVFLLL